MKKLLPVILVAIIVLSCFTISSCSGSATLSGTWVAYNAVSQSVLGDIDISYIKIDFFNDNTCVVEINYNLPSFNFPVTSNATYKIENGKLRIVSGDNVILFGDYSRKGNSFTVNTSSKPITFNKQ